MSKPVVVTITVGFNPRQIELLKGLDALYGETIDQKVHHIVTSWLHDNVPSLHGVGDED